MTGISVDVNYLSNLPQEILLIFNLRKHRVTTKNCYNYDWTSVISAAFISIYLLSYFLTLIVLFEIDNLSKWP